MSLEDIRKNWKDIKIPKIDFVRADDWVGMYVDGRLVMEGHSIFLEDVLDALGIDYVSRYAEDYLYNHGSCPDALSEVVFDKDIK